VIGPGGEGMTEPGGEGVPVQGDEGENITRW
jgi:hypothetical protein